MIVIADIGSNWRNLDDCLEAIRIAKIEGVDAVKFQYFTHEKLYGVPGKMDGELPFECIPKLAKECKAQGIEFLCSVFDSEDIARIDPYVKMHKIASAEADYVALRTKACVTKKPVLISCGCAHRYSIPVKRPFIPMACIAEYPTHDYPIEQILYFKEMGCKTYGMSDHNPYGDGYQIAKRMGCSYYEFHYNPLNITSPDKPHSIITWRRPRVKDLQPNMEIARRRTLKGYYRVK